MSISQAHQDRLVAQGRDEMMTAYLSSLERAPNEAQQRAASERFAGFMQEIIPQIVGVVSTGDYPAVAVELVDFTGKGKIMLKGKSAGDVGDMLCGKVGSSLTLVLTDAEQFDRQRPAAQFEPDQRPLPLEEVEDEFINEMTEIAEEGADQPAGWLFTAVEDEECRLADGTVIKPWTIVHGTMEVLVPLDAEAFVSAAVDHLNATAAEMERDMTPAEVRNAIMGVLHARQDQIGIAFHAPYSGDAPAVQDNAAPVEEVVKRGPKSSVEKAQAANDGWDAAATGKTVEDCPHAKGTLKDRWLYGFKLRQDGAAKPFLIGKSDQEEPQTGALQPAANDDAEARESTGNVAA